MDIFPPIEEKCTIGFKDKGEDCKTGLLDLWNLGQIEDLEINPDTLDDILDIYGVLKLSSKMNKQVFDKRFEVMENPGVQINIIYTSIIPTLYQVFYESDPRDFTIYNHVYPPDGKKFGQGDQEVLVTSAIAPGIKWAHEHKEGKIKNAKPINIIELCSEYKRRKSIYEDDDKKTITNSAYFGIDCDCRNPGNIIKSEGKDCGHKGIVEDPNSVKFVAASVITNDKGKIGERFQKFDEIDFAKYVNLCFLLKQNKDKEIRNNT